MREWIPVSERLPEEADISPKPYWLEWLVTDGEKVYITAVHPKNWNHGYVSRYSTPNITHWMPLPEVPKEGK